jgi:Ni/Co efflux regulator RcnB
MKRLFACAAMLGLFAFVPAVAQHNDHHGGKNDATGSHPGQGSPPAANHNGRAGRAVAPRTPSPATAPRNTLLPASGDVHPGPQGQAKGRQNNSGPGNATNHNPTVNAHQGNGVHPNNVVTRRPDINSLRHNLKASRHFRNGSYSPPRGYQSRHWSYGERLPRGYYARDYWIANFLMLDLFAPPPGLVWVRVGDDALLIDQISGDIVQVRYGLFY